MKAYLNKKELKVIENKDNFIIELPRDCEAEEIEVTIKNVH